MTRARSPAPAGPLMVILADDLSGAADCAVACRLAGHDTVVLIGEGADLAGKVVAIDADTRGRSAADAAAETARLTRRHLTPHLPLFRKLDSTLRGHVAAEFRAILDVVRATAAGPAAILMAAAFPALGRTAREGAYFLHGVPFEHTEIWRRERKAGRAFVPELLSSAALWTVVLGLDDVRAPGLSERLGEMLASGHDVLACDAETDDDLRRIAVAARPLAGRLVWAGSAGLARHLPDILLPPASRAAAPLPTTSRPILFAVGSLSAVSGRQAARLVAADAAALVTLDAATSDAALRGAASELASALGSGRDVVLTTTRGADANPADGAALARALGRLVAPHADHFGAFVATGGETARALLVELGVTTLDLAGSIEAGVPVGTVRLTGRGGDRDVPVVTKAGAFGTDETLLHVRAALRGKPIDRQHTRRHTMSRPVIAITMGDAAGVGAEIIVKSLAHAELYETCRPLVIGDRTRLQTAASLLASALEVRSIASVPEARFEPGTVDCIDLGLIPRDLPFGKLSAVAGDAAFQFLKVAIGLAVEGAVDAIVTAPLNKEALHAGGHHYPGHTEILAALTGTEEVSMMLTAPNLRVIHVTTHIGLLDAIAKIEPGLVQRVIERGHAVLEKAGLERRRIGVCAINPHSGEHGLFGRNEEAEKIEPAIAACRAKGWDIEGPLPADTLFYRAGRGDFDMVVAMYHDQGHGPVKVLGLEAGVNITVGLPVIRTSVDHGTAFDIAGTGKADERSLLEAIRQAVALAPATA